jgi:ribonuclease Z
MTSEQRAQSSLQPPASNLQVAIHSSPRFSTWIWIPDWKVLIDAGDGATQQLGYKIRKIDTVVCTHSHRDHIGGLLQVINQRGEAGPFALGHPCGGVSFRQLEAFANKFNPGTSHQAIWRELEEGDEIPGETGDRVIKCFRTKHYLDDHPNNAPRSLGFHLLWRKQKLKPELRDLPQKELDEIRLRHGREFLTEEVNEKWISVGGDGMPLSTQEVAGTRLLLHEATFLCPEDRDSLDDEEGGATDGYGHVHSTVQEALRVAHEAEIENLVLYHISTRYTDAEIRDTIRREAQKMNLRARVWAALPRRVYWNLLGDKPIWE